MPDQTSNGRRPDPPADESTLTAAPGPVQTQLTARPGDRFGRYKILGEIGQGGCGAVFVAEQEEPVRRRVALKVIKLGMDTREVIARFEAERQALALMDHPNIAKVFDAGASANGRPFFVMELVRGVPITRYCDEQRYTTQQRLALFIQVCQAVQHAHQKGVIHRDLKPSNVLVADHDGVPVPKIIDFGLAKATNGQRLTDQTLFTAFEQFMGTPAYMSPEQAKLSALDIDTRTDIYSLGVLLYELLTGRTPFENKRLLEAGLDEIRRVIRDVEPPRPSTKLSALSAGEQTELAKLRQSEPPKLVRLIRGDLDWIVMKCLEKERSRRYETANALAREVERYQTNEPIVARPPSQVYRLGKMVRRNKLAFGGGAVLAVALLLGLGGTSWQAVRATHARQRADEQRRRADLSAEAERREREAALREARRANAALSESLTTEGDRLVREKEMCRALAYFARALRINSSNSVAATRIVSLLNQCNFPLPIVRERMAVPAVRFPTPTNSPRLALRGKSVVDTRSGKELSRLQLDGEDSLLADVPLVFSPNGKVVAFCTHYQVGVFSTETGERILPSIRRSTPYCTPVFTPDSRHLIIGTSVVQVWDIAAKRAVFTSDDLATSIFTMALSPEGRLLATYYRDREVQIWNVLSGEAASESFAAGAPDGTWVGFRWGATATYLATAQYEPLGKTNSLRTRYWDTRPGGATPLLLRCSAPVDWACYAPAGQLVVVVARSGLAEVHRSDDGSLVTSASIPEQIVNLATFSPNSSLLALGTADGVVGVWDIARQRLLWTQRAHSRQVSDLAFTPDGRLVCSGEGARTLLSEETNSCAARVYDAQTGLLRGEITNSLGAVESIALSPDSRRLAVSFQLYRAEVWDLRTMKRLGEPLTDRQGWVWQTRFSHDGRWLATASGGDAAQLWDAHSPTNQPVQRFPHGHGVHSVCFSPDDTRVLTASEDGTARVWDRASGVPVTEPLTQSKGHRLLAGSFSPDGREVLTSGVGGTVVWDARVGRPLCAPFGHPAGARWASFSPDGSHILTAGPRLKEVAIYPWFGVQNVLGSWLADLAEAMAGARLNEDGVAEHIKAPEVQLERLRREIALADQSDPVVKWAGWYLADRTSRPLSFDSQITVRDYAQKLAAKDDLPSLLEALDLERTNGIVFGKLASLWEGSRPEFAALYRNIARALGAATNAVSSKPQSLSANFAVAQEAEVLPGFLDPRDGAALLKRVGEKVKIRGRVVRFGMSSSQTFLYLNFTQDYREGLALVFRISDNPAEFRESRLRGFLNKTVTVEGTITQHLGRPELLIRSLFEIKVQDE